MATSIFAIFSGVDFWELRESETSQKAEAASNIPDARAIPIMDHVVTLMDAAEDNGFDLVDLICELFNVRASMIFPEGKIWIEDDNDARFLTTSEMTVLFNRCEGNAAH